MPPYRSPLILSRNFPEFLKVTTLLGDGIISGYVERFYIPVNVPSGSNI
jgi:hypothetical protein